MPRLPRKKNQVSTWFNRVIAETRRGDIFEDKIAIATLDTGETLYSRLPSRKEVSEIEMKMAGAEGGVPPAPEGQYQYIIQKMEQMERDKRTSDEKMELIQQGIEGEKIKKKTRLIR